MSTFTIVRKHVIKAWFNLADEHTHFFILSNFIGGTWSI